MSSYIFDDKYLELLESYVHNIYNSFSVLREKNTDLVQADHNCFLCLQYCYLTITHFPLLMQYACIFIIVCEQTEHCHHKIN